MQDINGNPLEPSTRIYTTSIAQPFHCDVSDIVGKFLVARYDMTCHLEQ